LNSFKNVVVLSLLLGTSIVAHATPASVKFTGTATGTSANVQIPLGTQNFFLGNYNEQESGVSSFLAYCIDPFQYVSTSYQTYDKSILGLGNFSTNASTRLNNVTSLFSHAYAGSVNNAVKAAGFQLALWEAFNDDMNLSSGIVKKTGSTDVTVLSEAQSLIDNLVNNNWSSSPVAYQLTAYTSQNFQDFITVTPVPEPESIALLLAGLGLFGFTVRRNK